MITGIVIPHDKERPLVEKQFDGLTDYQAAVGGYIEPVYVEGPKLTFFANEEGKVHGLPENRRATCLWWLLSPEARGRDILVGNIVLIGSKRGRGTSTDIPPELIKLLMERVATRSRFRPSTVTTPGTATRSSLIATSKPRSTDSTCLSDGRRLRTYESFQRDQ